MKALLKKLLIGFYSLMIVLFPTSVFAESWGSLSQSNLTIFALITGIVLLLLGISGVVMVCYVALTSLKKR